MNRRTLLTLGAVCVFLGLTGFSEIRAPAGTPKLMVRLHPASGVLPLGPTEAGIYTFEVLAIDEEQRRIYASDQTLVGEGQIRRVHRKIGNVEVRGVVSLSDTRMARYRAELSTGGTRVAATDAWITLDPPR